ncbi:endolytic transglycosylase MltG [Microbacterium sp. SORGH_AS_0888]|uniref:endolytic transglycosylase MltG n=1 Tax=Microbacterium sp. SORGH_AS_0888 TaxID=3041791 RepID=UPI00278ACD4E|nr:endolytic transglycosylase MltG [Microbacterium sp. SORGH_AS_0888]MDQ1128533.1 UPF0755 protein [Microbacterium sp. SORGH_AS_0888]
MSDTPPPSRRAAREAREARPTAETPSTGQAGDLEDLFTGRATTEAIGAPPARPTRRRRRAAGWIAFAIVVVLLGGLAGAGLWVWNTYEPQIRSLMGWQEPSDYEAGIAEGEATVTITSGDTGANVSDALFQAGVTRTSGVVYSYLVSSGQNPDFQPGVYKLQLKMTAAAAVAALLDPANRMSNTVQLQEGLTVSTSLERISSALQMSLDDLKAAAADPSAYGVSAPSLEGWLFPATYTFDPGTTPHDVIRTMVDRSVKALDDAQVAATDRERILTIASIIQREARNTDDFYKVSRVIQNRLDIGMKLQMDSTAQYGYGSMHDGTVSSSAAALADDNKWNTYVITGLPATPIANPGDLAIDAALHPAAGDWLYFVTVNLDTGETVFTSNDADHEAAVEQWRAWCTDHPDAGC